MQRPERGTEELDFSFIGTKTPNHRPEARGGRQVQTCASSQLLLPVSGHRISLTGALKNNRRVLKTNLRGGSTHDHPQLQNKQETLAVQELNPKGKKQPQALIYQEEMSNKEEHA